MSDSHSAATGSTREIATLGGGCFWCLEAVFEQLRGVEAVASGYAGGAHPNPTYRQVCGGGTGHAEVVQITFDPAVLTYRELLEVFFQIHDPTTLNRQGADIGTQYRSIILYHSPEQKETAERWIAQLNEANVWPSPIVTEVVPYSAFHRAEDYHQEYYRHNATQPYCQTVIAPKISKFHKLFADKTKT
ncbi:MAG: peptide-methionine (S)-S-oxide reductase MsrA [Gemmataceae bacterium]